MCYVTGSEGSRFVADGDQDAAWSSNELLAMASAGEFVGTVTGRHGEKANVDHPQPALGTLSAIERQSGRQRFPMLYDESLVMTIQARHLDDSPHIVIDGRRVEGSVTSGEGEKITIELAELPAEGMHLLQLQNRGELFSNDFIFHAAADEAAAIALRERIEQTNVPERQLISDAIAANDLDHAGALLHARARINSRGSQSRATPSSEAAVRGQVKMVQLLIDRGADVNATNKDGNTPLHAAAFTGHLETVSQLLKNGSDATIRNDRDQTPLDIATSESTAEVTAYFNLMSRAVGVKATPAEVQERQKEVARLLKAATFE